MSPSLLHSFYKEIQTTYGANNPSSFSSTVEINAAHPIFNGHFKQVAITPGVCIIQMIKEVIEEKLKTTLILEEGNNIKFLAMVNPNTNAELTLDLQLSNESEHLLCTATCKTEAGICVKFKGKFGRIS